MRYIPESEYRTFVAQRRRELAEAVAASGLTIADIASGTRMKWQTVHRIAHGKSVRNESQDRVRCYLDAYKQFINQQDEKNKN
jgi:hypothetical protein